MIPSRYTCSSCNESLAVPDAENYYYTGNISIGMPVDNDDLYLIPVRPAWCKDCASLCMAENIRSIRDFENAYEAVRSGKTVEYPRETENLDNEAALHEVKTLLQWRMSRRRAARALCCGGENYQFMDVSLPLFKHAECDFGYMEARYLWPGSYNGPGPGVNSPANIRLYDPEGELIGQLTWYKREENKWDTEKLSYPRAVEE
ncbi:hypothetical protein ACO0LL_24530 [Undibacterium sp. TC4M20W]|uniref:hypothetical protein n=1 Tax=Undibacterium sp. TC4M20W TaxID=3413052 RepID=UPI003BF0E026